MPQDIYAETVLRLSLSFNATARQPAFVPHVECFTSLGFAPEAEIPDRRLRGEPAPLRVIQVAMSRSGIDPLTGNLFSQEKLSCRQNHVVDSL